MENKNVFDETVYTLINDAKSLQRKFTKLQDENNFHGAIECMRLLKDTLSLIKEYDWELKYSEYETDGHKEISVWEQNNCGEIRNHKKWIVTNVTDKEMNFWFRIFEDNIISKNSYLANNGNIHRATGKSYALAKLCDKYNGCIIVDKYKTRASGIKNNCELFNFKENIYTYREVVGLRQFRNKILFIDEDSGLNKDQIDNLMKNHIVVGFLM